MSYSRTAIANLAYSHLEAPAVSNVDTDPSPNAKAIRSVWDTTLDLALGDHTWNFAISRWRNRAPVVASANPAPEVWAYAFEKPGDCIKVLQVNPDGDNRGARFHVEGGLILCNDALATLRGIRRVTEPGRYSVWFVDYFSCRLALRISKTLQASEAIRESIKKATAEALQKARQMDGQEGTLDPIFKSTFLAARFGDESEEGGW